MHQIPLLAGCFQEFYQCRLNRQYKKNRFPSETDNENSICFLDIEISRTITNSRLHFTVNLPLAESFPTLEASSQGNLNTTCCLPYYTEQFCSNYEFFIRKMIS